jgi:ubiquinone/menaquinone biosynthesis C-methylase UbiE
MKKTYVHGYDLKESIRLQDQASTLVELLHGDTSYPPGSRILEAGCGVGSQTITLARNSPEALITSVDISSASIAEARQKASSSGIKNVRFEQADIFNLPYQPNSFDHVFLCFVLEHLSRPIEVLKILKDMLVEGGTITVIEGDHGSAYFYPDSKTANQAIQCQVELQRRAGGNANVGRELYPLMCQAGYNAVHVSPRMVYVDSSKPEFEEGFTRKTFIAMIEGIRESAIEAGLIKKETFDQGISDLYKTAEGGGTFCYTFFKGVGVRSECHL